MHSTATFIDGPADGGTLDVDRPTIMLRVASGGIVCRILSNDDWPAPGEEVHAYIMCQRPATGFWDGRDPKTNRRIGGQFWHATYRLCKLQPTDFEGTWYDWCEANEAALKAEHDAYLTKATS